MSAHILRLMCRLMHPRLGNCITKLLKSRGYRPWSVLGNARYQLDYVNFINRSFCFPKKNKEYSYERMKQSQVSSKIRFHKENTLDLWKKRPWLNSSEQLQTRKFKVTNDSQKVTAVAWKEKSLKELGAVYKHSLYTDLRDTVLRKLKKYLKASIVPSAIKHDSNTVAVFFSFPSCWALKRPSCRWSGRMGSGSSLKNCLRSPATSHGSADERQFSPWSSLLWNCS